MADMQVDPAPEQADARMDTVEDVIGKDIDLSGDGGVVKKILEKGTLDEMPEKGDEVNVHYTGTLLDGTKFDSSRDRDSPFSFKLGEGRVIKGWDIGVATMKKGEKAILTCKPEYAYGAQGSPPTIPPNSTLNFEVELLSWQSAKDISGDGGVIKNVITEGEGSGYEMPGEKDQVLVHYKVRVAGSEAVVAQSPEEGATFTVSEPGPGILPGMVTAVKTMKKGDVVSLKLSPEYGYGDAGLPPHVAAGAKLEVELELRSWIKVEDVTDDGGVVRKVLSAPDKVWKTPNQGAKATVSYTATLADGTIFDQRLEGNELTFTVDEEEVPEGLDLAVQKMKEGEHDVVVIQPGYGFGNTEHQGSLAVVPPGSTITYDIKLISHENAKESWEMNDAEKVAWAGVNKDKGNKAFKDGHLERAVRCYEKATSSISYDKSFPDDIKAQARELRKTCHLNLAAVKVKQQQWKEVVKNCDKVLETDPDNIKALYRRAHAYLSTQDFLEAELDIKKGLCLQPDNQDLQLLQKKLKVVQREVNKKESALYGKMFKKSTAEVPVKAPTAMAS